MNESAFQYAGFWRRFVAMLIDSFILTVIQIGILVILTFGAYVKVRYWPFEEMVNQLGGWMDVLWLILYWVYFAGMESSSKQATLGKMVLGLQVTDSECNRITFLRATGRNMAKILSALTLLIGYLMAAFTEKKQALHDLTASCLVIKRKESSFWKLVLIAMVFLALLTSSLGAYVYYIIWPQWAKATEEVLQDPEKLLESLPEPSPEKAKAVKESSASAGTDLKQVAAAADVKEELAQNHLKVMESFLEIVSKVNNVSSAKQAHPELADLAAQNKDIFQKAKSLNISNDDMVKYIQEHHKKRGEAVFQQIFTVMPEMSKLKDFMEIGNYIGKEVNELTNNTWASVSF